MIEVTITFCFKGIFLFWHGYWISNRTAVSAVERWKVERRRMNYALVATGRLSLTPVLKLRSPSLSAESAPRSCVCCVVGKFLSIVVFPGGRLRSAGSCRHSPGDLFFIGNQRVMVPAIGQIF